MGWFSDRIDVHFKMCCLNCGYSFYPYNEDAAFSRIPSAVFEIFSRRECPECKEKRWGHN